MGSISFTASKPSYHRGFYPLLSGVVHVPFPDPYRPVIQSKPGEDYGETIVRFIEEEIFGHLLPSDEVAGVLVETIQGEGGYMFRCRAFTQPCARCVTGTACCWWSTKLSGMGALKMVGY
jgi:4-aminobutyrate aminotransferase